jgi:hypothetical protein
MSINKAYLLQLIHEGQQRGKNLPAADKLWLAAMFVDLAQLGATLWARRSRAPRQEA